MIIPLELAFKGARHYIQGGDFFNAVESTVRLLFGEQRAHIGRLSFTRFSYHITDLCIDEEFDPTSSVGQGELVLIDGCRKSFWLREGIRVPSGRRPYDEDGMVAFANFSDNSATLNAPIQYTPIEAVIALTKVLNYRLATPSQGKWVFGMIDLNQALPAIGKDLTITRIKGVPGRFSVNEIVIDGRQVGIIQFIVGSP